MTAEPLPKKAARVREHLRGLVASEFLPGVAVLLAHRDEVEVAAAGTLAFEGAGSDTPIGGDTICRLGSMSKPYTAACAMTLVEDGTLGLDDPLDDLLPELAGMRVLADPGGPLTETVPAKAPVTLRGLLVSTFGTGMVMTPSPIAEALDRLGRPAPDEWMSRLGALPLIRQPGEAWLYDTAANVTGVLIARATGMSFGEALRERVFAPLGMEDSGFTVAAADLGRFATAYVKDAPAGARPAVDDPPDGEWSRPRPFESGGGGMVSTGNDYLAFARALLSGERLLSRASVELMTTDHLTPSQKKLSGFGPDYFDTMGWGFGMSVATAPDRSGHAVGTYGWPGYYGTAWYSDPAEQSTTIVIMQREHYGNQRLPFWDELWASVHGAG